MKNLNKEYTNSKEYYKSLIASEKMWEWLCDNPTKSKKDYLTLKHTKVDCAICANRLHFSCKHSSDEFYCSGVDKSDIKWSPCFLYKICKDYATLWKYNRNEETRRLYAEKIYFAILKERLKRM